MLPLFEMAQLCPVDLRRRGFLLGIERDLAVRRSLIVIHLRRLLGLATRLGAFLSFVHKTLFVKRRFSQIGVWLAA